jgi:hypothetical protein
VVTAIQVITGFLIPEDRIIESESVHSLFTLEPKMACSARKNNFPVVLFINFNYRKEITFTRVNVIQVDRMQFFFFLNKRMRVACHFIKEKKIGRGDKTFQPLLQGQ